MDNRHEKGSSDSVFVLRGKNAISENGLRRRWCQIRLYIRPDQTPVEGLTQCNV